MIKEDAYPFTSSGAFNNVAILEENVTPVIHIIIPNKKADKTEVNTAERNFFLSSDEKRRDNTETAPIVNAWPVIIKKLYT